MSVEPTFDLNTILVSALGSLIAMVGSIIVAVLYIRSQNIREKEKRLNEQIQETYIEQGILPIQVALQEYGTSAIFAMIDVGRWAVRAMKFENNEDLLKTKMEEIASRSTIKDFKQRKFSYAIQGIPYLRRFGKVLYGSIIRTLQNYGELCTDITSYDVIKKQIDEAGVDEVFRSIQAIAQLIQESQLYLQNRLDNVIDFVWQKDFDSYTDFLNIFKEEKYAQFIENLEQYNKLYTNVIDAMHQPQAGEARKDATLALSKWLSEQTEINPFENNKEKISLKPLKS